MELFAVLNDKIIINSDRYNRLKSNLFNFSVSYKKIILTHSCR